MTKKIATLLINDEVNCQFKNVDVVTRRKMSQALTFRLPYAHNLPAVKLGRWDGTIRYCDVAGRTFVNLLDQVLPILVQDGYELTLEDQRPAVGFEFDQIHNTAYSHMMWPEGHRFEGQPIMLMDHQTSVINNYLQNPQCVQSISTGAGKTLVTAILSDQVSKYGRSLVIVPNRDLVTQTHEQYVNLGLDVGVFFGGKKEFGHTHTICTWQSLEVLNKKSKTFDPSFDINLITKDVVCVMVDEAHSTSATVLKNLMSQVFNHVPIRWGLTGTIPREKIDSTALVAMLGPVVNYVRAHELQEQGILANLNINILQLDDPPMRFKQWSDEYKYLTTHMPRLEWLASHIEQSRQDGNTLVLVNRIETGQQLASFVADAVFVSGSMKGKTRQQEYKDVQTAQNKVIVATYGVAAVGIDIPRIFNLYLFEPGKSFVRVIQSIGRGIRKANDKDFVKVFDICSTLKYSRRHVNERKRFYKESQYPHTQRKVSF